MSETKKNELTTLMDGKFGMFTDVIALSMLLICAIAIKSSQISDINPVSTHSNNYIPSAAVLENIDLSNQQQEVKKIFDESIPSSANADQIDLSQVNNAKKGWFEDLFELGSETISKPEKEQIHIDKSKEFKNNPKQKKNSSQKECNAKGQNSWFSNFFITSEETNEECTADPLTWVSEIFYDASSPENKANYPLTSETSTSNANEPVWKGFTDMFDVRSSLEGVDKEETGGPFQWISSILYNHEDGKVGQEKNESKPNTEKVIQSPVIETNVEAEHGGETIVESSASKKPTKTPVKPDVKMEVEDIIEPITIKKPTPPEPTKKPTKAKDVVRKVYVEEEQEDESNQKKKQGKVFLVSKKQHTSKSPPLVEEQESENSIWNDFASMFDINEENLVSGKKVSTKKPSKEQTTDIPVDEETEEQFIIKKVVKLPLKPGSKARKILVSFIEEVEDVVEEKVTAKNDAEKNLS